MKTRPGVSLCLAISALALGASNIPLAAQELEPAVAAAPEMPTPTRFTAAQLDQLLGPIALYPDALIALILPASTAPVDLVLASRYLKDGGDPAAVDSHAWEESVKGLAHYPDVVNWMDDNLTWTRQLGQAFAEQPEDVMQSIQRLRAITRANGVLADTPQQIVVPEDDYIRIVPTRPDVIYVPYYQPEVVFVDQPVYYPSNSFLTFGIGYSVGAWLVNDCDWRHRQVWVVDRHWSWRDHRDWRNPIFPGQPGFVNTPIRHPWHPAVAPTRPQAVAVRAGSAEILPANPNAPATRPDRRTPSARTDERSPATPPNRALGFTQPPATTNQNQPVATQPVPANRERLPSQPQPRDDTPPTDRRRNPQNVAVATPPPVVTPAATGPVAGSVQPPTQPVRPMTMPSSTPVVRSFSGPVIQPMANPIVAPVAPPTMHLPSPPPPAPAHVAPPAPPPASPPPSDGRRGGPDTDQKKQAN